MRHLLLYINIIASVQILYGIIMMSGGAAQTPRPIEIVILFRARRSLDREKHRYIDNIRTHIILYITNRFLNAYEIKNLKKKTYGYAHNIYYYTSYYHCY